MLGERDEDEVEEVPLLPRWFLSRQEQVEVLGEGQPAHQVAGEIAAAHLDPIRVRLAQARDRLARLADHARAPSTSRAPATMDWSLRNASWRVRYFMPQSGATTRRSGGSTSSARSMRAATTSGVSAPLAPRSSAPRTMTLSGTSRSVSWPEPGLRSLERQVCRGAVVELSEERIAVGTLVNDVGVAEARVEHRLAVDSLECAVDGLDRVAPSGLGSSLEVRLIDLDDVGTGRLQVSELLVDGHRVREREAALVAVVVVLRLLRQRERPGNGDLDAPVGEESEELDIANLDRPHAPNRADDSRHRVLVAGAVERHTRCVQVDALERRREAVGVALSAHLAVRDDVDAGALHVGYREPGRVVLRLLEVRLGDPPEPVGADARRQPLAEPFAVDRSQLGWG